jgi:hypothetical protein
VWGAVAGGGDGDEFFLKHGNPRITRIINPQLRKPVYRNNILRRRPRHIILIQHPVNHTTQAGRITFVDFVASLRGLAHLVECQPQAPYISKAANSFLFSGRFQFGTQIRLSTYRILHMFNRTIQHPTISKVRQLEHSLKIEHYILRFQIKMYPAIFMEPEQPLRQIHHADPDKRLAEGPF